MKKEIKVDALHEKLYQAILIMFIFLTAGMWLLGFALPDFLMGLLLGLALGGSLRLFFHPRFPSISIDEDGLSTQNTVWNQSFRWSELRDVTLHKNRISVKFQKTGAGDNIRIPFLMRRKLPQLHEAISYHSSRAKVNFSSYQNEKNEELHAV